MSTRETSAGAHSRSLAPRHYAERGTPAQFKIPAGSLPFRASLESGEVPRTPFDILMVFCALLVLCIIGNAVAFAFFYYLFL